MKTDKLFYNLVRELPQIFFEIIGKPNTDSSIYTFIAQAVKEQSFNLDSLLSTIAGHDTEPMYFVEAQAYKDDKFYERFFGQIFVYFGQYSPPNSEWYAIVIYDRKRHETPPHPRYKTLVDNHLIRIYLKELVDNGSLATGIAKLFVETRKKAASLAERLITQASEEIDDETNQSKVLEFIQDIVANKFPKLSRKEIEVMLKISDETKKTGYYKSVKKETFLEAAQKLLKEGDSIERVARVFDLDIEEVRKLAEKQSEVTEGS